MVWRSGRRYRRYLRSENLVAQKTRMTEKTWRNEHCPSIEFGWSICPSVVSVESDRSFCARLLVDLLDEKAWQLPCRLNWWNRTSQNYVQLYFADYVQSSGYIAEKGSATRIIPL